MPRQKRREVLGTRDRTDTRPAAAVGDAKSLVQVEMHDVGPDLGRPAETKQPAAADTESELNQMLYWSAGDGRLDIRI